MIFRRAALMVAAVLGTALAVPVTASAASCGITWGSLPKSAPSTTSDVLVDIRAGQQACYDRLVFDLNGPVDGYDASYVPEVIHDPTGNPVPLRGGAKLAVTVRAPAYDASGNPTYIFANQAELVNVAGYQTFRQVAWAGSFEGLTTVGLGVRATLPFRVFTLSGPNRIVVDVAHSW